MSRPRQTARRDAWHAPLPPGDPRRAQIIAWHQADGWQSCCQRIFSELGIGSPKDASKPIGHAALYDALAFWRAQEITSEMFAFRDAQEELMKQFKPGDAKLAREFGEFALLQKANAAQDKDIFSAATSAQDSRRRLDLEEAHGKTKAQQGDAKLAQKDEELRQSEKRLELLQFDASRAALAELKNLKTIAADRTLSEPEKVAAVRLKLFGTPKTEAGMAAAKGAA
jgi:hypothetical protein